MRYKYPQRTNLRLKGYDYAKSGSYFITFCVKDKHCLLGKVQGLEVALSEYGRILHEEILRSRQVRLNVTMDAFVIMPNHAHMILKISGTVCVGSQFVDDPGCFGKHQILLDQRAGECNSPLRSPSQTIGSVVRGIKSSVSHRIGFSMFQRGYYDTIIRNDAMYREIIEYIANNPQRWQFDKFYCYEVAPEITSSLSG